jgi:outer membrane protein OmpA-like peptidoglycan-associated protein
MPKSSALTISVPRGPFDRQLASECDLGRRRPSFRHLHDEVGAGVRRQAKVVDGHDVRVLQPRHGDGFALESQPGAFVDDGSWHHHARNPSGGLVAWLQSLVSFTPRHDRHTPDLVEAPAAPNVDLGALVDMRLPNGVSLNIPTNGVENRLSAFIGDAIRPVDKATWFSFGRLEFETGSAQLRPSSQEQLRNVAEILKAYPQVHLKIGGYTDNSGNPATNLKLSADRATNTMNALVALGVDRGRLAAEGYGEQHPVADNATEEGRQRNRRIDVNVTKK